VVSILVVFYS